MSQNSGGNQQEKKEPMIQRPLKKYKQDLVKKDAELARKLQQEEEERSKQFLNDEMLAQQISNDLNRNGFTNGATLDEPCGLQQEFTRYRGMTEVDALLARQIQEQEEKSVLSARCQSPGQQDAELAHIVQEEEAAQYQQFHEDKMLAQQISDIDLDKERGSRSEFQQCLNTELEDALLAQQMQQVEQPKLNGRGGECHGRIGELIPDALLPRQIQQEEQSLVPGACRREELTPLGGMMESDALLAQQIQQDEQSQVPGAWSPFQRQQDAGVCRRVVSRAPDHRITIRANGRRRPNIPMRNQAQLPAGEDDPDTLLMTIGGGLETNFINIMRDPHLVIMALSRTPQFTGNQANVDLNDYEGLLDLAERLGEVQNRGMTPGDIGNLPTHSHQGGATAAGQNTDCQVCLTGFEQGETIRTLPCLHEYHQSCVDEWLQRNSTCPICRQNVKESM